MLPTDSMYVGHMVMLVNKYELSYHHVLSVVSGHMGKKNISNLSVSNIRISSRQPFNPKIKICFTKNPTVLLIDVSEVMAAWQKLKLRVYNGRYTSEQEQTVQNFQILIEKVQLTW